MSSLKNSLLFGNIAAVVAVAVAAVQLITEVTLRATNCHGKMGQIYIQEQWSIKRALEYSGKLP